LPEKKMNKKIFLVLICLTSLCGIETFAQSRRQGIPADAPAKINKREPRAAETPKPESTPDNDKNTTNIETIPEATKDVSETVDEKDVIRVDTDLVTIPVKVSDRSGRFIAGLKKENFRIFEDGKEQEIAYFSNVEEPFTVALVLDMSYSATFKINEIQSAAIAFINQLHPNDKIMVVSFDEEVHVLSEPTGDRQRLASAIRSTQIASGTSLYEAVDLVINKRLKNISGRKAIVLFTDGVDTTSRRAHDLNNLNDAYELDALIYPIEYDTFSDVQAMKDKPVVMGGSKTGVTVPHMPSSTNPPFPFPIPTTGVGTPGGQGTSPEDYRKAQEYLEQLATRTSGRVYQANTTANLTAAFTKIANELRQIYSLGFYPSEQKEGKRRQLKVKTDQEKVSVQARDSYIVAKKKK
jgi:VWFA-related protein